MSGFPPTDLQFVLLFRRYGKYIGELWDQGLGKDPATSRCVMEKDAGYTKADGPNLGAQDSTTTVRKGNRKHFCLHFARGMCAKGKDCIFFHRIPTPKDDSSTEELVDCFGRQRHAKHRDDMNGTGSFMSPCRTLYVAGLQKNSYPNNGVGTLEEALKRHFIEWGEIEEAKVIHRLSIGFVRYRLRTSSEFAKEAMSNQALDKNEVLQIRWAYDDPNPVAIDAARKADQDIMYALLKAKGIGVEAANFDYPADYEIPEAKKIKLENGIDVTEERPDLAYPDTSAQYATVEKSNLPTAVPSSSSRSSSTFVSEVISTSADSDKKLHKQGDQSESDESGTEDVWERFQDEATGAYYYFNTSTGESSWTDPTHESGKD